MIALFQKLVAPIGTAPRLKRALSIFAYAVVPIAGLFATVFFPSRELFRGMGSVAQAGLLAIIFMKPIAFVVPLRFLQRALVYRRQMGVATFWFALFHSVGFMYTYNLLSPREFFGWTNTLLYAGVAMLMLGVLAATSNNAAVRHLKGNWKRIQYLAYPALFLVIIHSSTIRSRVDFASIILAVAAFCVLKYAQAKKFRLDAHFPFLQQWGL